MKIEKYIEISEYMEIDVTSEDIQIVFDGDHDNVNHIMIQINSFFQFMKWVSEQKINQMTNEQHGVIHRFFKEQAGRFQEMIKKCCICGAIADEKWNNAFLCNAHYRKLIPEELQGTEKDNSE